MFGGQSGLRLNEIRSAQRALARRSTPIMVVNQLQTHVQNRVRDLVTSIRRSNSTGPLNENLIYKTANGSGATQASKLDEIMRLLFSEHPNFLQGAQHARLYIRYRSNISTSYANQQTLHVNVLSNPSEGKSFLQFIYYIDTPKIGRNNAPVSERGSLLLRPRNRNSRVVVPEKGTIVFFSPDEVLHEVVAPLRNYPGNVNRNMIIGFLYKPTTNTRNISTQLRPGEPYTRATRAIAGTSRETGTRVSNNTLRNLMTSMSSLRIPSAVRRRSSAVVARRARSTATRRTSSSVISRRSAAARRAMSRRTAARKN
jgi:hypothetical protein